MSTHSETVTRPEFQHPASIVPGVVPGTILESHEPKGVPTKEMWQYHKDHMELVSPLNRRKFKVLVVGTGLAAGAAAAALGELGYTVKAFTYHDAPRRAHSIAAQGGVNSARGKKVDNDGAYRHVKDTDKGGDYRCRESDCWRLAYESVRVIDHMNAIGAPFAREYGGALATRSFGGVQVSRTYYTRGQTGQQLQLSTASALQRQIHLGTVEIFTHNEMVDLVITETDGEKRCEGVVMRNLITGELTAHTGHAVILGTGGYGNVFHMSTLAKNSNAGAMMRAFEAGAYLASPSFIQFHPTGLPVNSEWQSKTILMSESLRNDGRSSPKMIVTPTPFPKRNATTSWSGATRHSVTWCPVTWLLVLSPNKSTKASGLGRCTTQPISTSVTLLNDWGKIPFGNGTPTFSKCMRKPLAKTPTPHPCVLHPPATSPWAACGPTSTK